MAIDLNQNGDVSDDKLSKHREKDIGKISARLNSITIVLINPNNKNLKYLMQRYKSYFGKEPSDKEIKLIKQSNNL